MREKDKDLATVERTIEILEQWNMDPMMGTWYATNSETVRSILGALDAAQEVAARHRFPNPSLTSSNLSYYKAIS